VEIGDGLLLVFNVDHGACALLSMPTGTPGQASRVLIDCGHSTEYRGQPWYPGAYLRSRGIGHIDLLICTNYDEDHASGAPSLKEHGVSVGCILGNPTVPPEAIEHLKSEDGMGDGIRLIATSLAERRQLGRPQIPPSIPGLGLQWFWNPWPFWDSENDLSLVAHLNIKGINFLFPGDLEKKGCLNMLKLPSFAELMSGLDVLVAAHHGRENGKCESMFDDHGCSPALVVISDCAKQYQSQETVPYYYGKARGITDFRGQGPRYVLTTRRDDYIAFRFGAQGCFVS
jgi:beta-lactamase superfamily II metal-dependent hydrolase